jgi:hypothetical protein
MRLLLGIILGVLLTVAGAYIHDTSRADARAMVNWDVVDQNWRDLRANLRDVGNRVHDEWVKRFG